MKRYLSLLIFVFTFCGVITPVQAEFYGTPATGLLVLEKKYPYYLFVPPEYSQDKSWPLLIIMGERAAEPKELIEAWVEWAKQKKVMVMAVPTLVPEKDLPEAADRWLINVKRDILERYRVDPSNILLMGTGFGAQYAAYLGLSHPEEFGAVALVKGAWVGPFERLVKATSDRKRQISFYVLVNPQDKDYAANEKKALSLEQKGYQIKMEPLKKGEDWLTARDPLFAWFNEHTEFRALKRKGKADATVKGKIKEIRQNIFGI